MPPVAAAIGAVISGISSAISAAAVSLGGLVSFASIGAFLASPIGALVIGIGLQLIAQMFVRKPQAPSVEAGKVTVRVAEPERWLVAGHGRQGGGILFAEYDANGNFWYLTVHADGYFTERTDVYLDDIIVTLNETNQVITDDFCLDNAGNIFDDEDTPDERKPYYTIWTTTHTRTDPTPPQIPEFQAAFPGADGWTNDHKLVGTSYSVVKVNSVSSENRYKVFRWRGPVGMGEPACSIVARWAEPYDPRTATYAHTENTALIWAYFRTHPFGRGKPFDSINWDRIAEQADICDISVIGIDGTQRQYECWGAFAESKERNTAEQEILLAMDGVLTFDDDGKCWARAGYYYAPTLQLNRGRDIMAMESVEAQNGESETQGVIVRYNDPAANYTVQPAAPWKNPIYYVEGETPKYLNIDAQCIKNHNQAMRLAKSIGYRSQSVYKIQPITFLRGLKAQKERIFNLLYDNVFAGDHEIVTTVELDENGIFCSFGAVPVDENRWKLLAGEEQHKPVYAEIDIDTTPVLATGVIVAYDGAKFVIAFDPAPREDWNYIFQYRLVGDPTWIDMFTNMVTSQSISGAVPQNQSYEFQYRTVTSQGKSTPFIDPPIVASSAIISISGTPVLTGNVGVPYAGFTVSASGGTTPYFFIDLYGRLPPGITIDPSSGVVSGTPTTNAVYPNIIIRASDINNAFNYLPTFAITISP